MQQALIIDDSKAIRRILGATIRELGFDVAEAGNGREALEELARLPGPVRLILVDWNMPEMNGMEFLLALQGRERHPDTKVMMVTTETAIDQMIKALEAGADEYIMKPFTRDAIVDKLRLLGIVN
ncbi:MAG: response regulator [Acidobacteria bacterium]|nr:response regulator [Acidobacteriota bacterium]